MIANKKQHTALQTLRSIRSAAALGCESTLSRSQTRPCLSIDLDAVSAAKPVVAQTGNEIPAGDSYIHITDRFGEMPNLVAPLFTTMFIVPTRHAFSSI
jgi:hypothetical protein